MVLTWLIFIPAIGGTIAWLAARWSILAARWIAFLACAGDLGLAIGIRIAHPGIIDQSVPWITGLGVSYHLFMDGLSWVLVLLTGLLGAAAVVSSWSEITDRVGAFYFALLTLLTGILGVFLARDLFLFYFFWELMLVPMYFVIGIWGHENRYYAALKFFLFTFISGLFMLVAIIGLYVLHGRATGVYTFDYDTLIGTAMPFRYAFWLMLGFFVAFAVKLPTVPVHTWLADAHTEAPTAGSVILAGLMLKTGAYGFVRFAVPLFPRASADIASAAMVLGTIGILYGGLLAYAQRDFKRLVAYTSVSHMGFVLLGIYAGTPLALQGAVIQIIAHGLSTGALFLLVGMLQERTGTRDFGRLGGLWATIPKFGGFTMFFAMGALGLPGLANFVGEFMVLIGTFTVKPIIAVVASAGFIASVIYALRMVQLTVWGPNEHDWRLPDLNAREVAVLGVLAALLLWLGFYPQPVFTSARTGLVPVQQSLHGRPGL